MVKRKIKSVLAGAVALLTAFSTLPAANVIAAEPEAQSVEESAIFSQAFLETQQDRLRHAEEDGADFLVPEGLEVLEESLLQAWTSTRTTKSATYDADGNELNHYEYTYSPVTGLETKEEYVDVKNPEYNHAYVYEYDANGNNTKYSYYSAGKLSWYNTYEYDAKGNTSKINYFDANGKSTGYATYERTFYDNGKTKTNMYSSYDTDGNCTYRWLDEYNEKGYYYKETNWNLRDNNLVVTSIRLYDRDDKGRNIKSTQYDAEMKVMSYTVYEYYGDNWTTKSQTTYDADNNVTYKYEYEYEEKSEGDYTYYIRKGSKEYTLVDGELKLVRETKYTLDDNNVTVKDEETEFREYYSLVYVNGESAKYSVGEYKDGNQVKESYYKSADDKTLVAYRVYEYKTLKYNDNGSYVPAFEDFDKNLAEGKVFMWRLYNPNSGEHFYTGSKEEVQNLINVGWNFEGPGFIFDKKEGDAVYRLYNETIGDHMYTMNLEEVAALEASGWKNEGRTMNSASPETGKPMYRLANPNATGAGKHHFTMSAEEKDNLIAIGWVDEGIGWYSE